MLLFIDNVPHKNGFECASAEVCNYGQAYYPRAGLSSLCHMPLPSTMMMKVRLFMIVFKNYSRLGACMHTANHPEDDTPRDH